MTGGTMGSLGLTMPPPQSPTINPQTTTTPMSAAGLLSPLGMLRHLLIILMILTGASNQAQARASPSSALAAKLVASSSVAQSHKLYSHKFSQQQTTTTPQ